MISLRRTMAAQEAQHDWQTALGAHIAILEAIRDYAFRACPPLLDDYTQELITLRRRISEQAGTGDLCRSRDTLVATVRRFGEDGSKAYETRTKEIREVVKLVASGAAAFLSRSRNGSQEMAEQARAVEEIAAIGDLTELREKLTAQVTRMRLTLERMAREDAETIQRLSGEMDGLRERLHAAEQACCEDELTGLANRRGLERQMDTRIRRQQPFCLLLFDIRNLRSINEANGHWAGDGVLREFASRLRHGIRETDVACRWGGDEFLLLLDCPLHDVLPRSRQIYARLNGGYAVAMDGKQVHLQLITSMGVAEHRTGEAKEQLLGRAEALLYTSGDT